MYIISKSGIFNTACSISIRVAAPYGICKTYSLRTYYPAESEDCTNYEVIKNYDSEEQAYRDFDIIIDGIVSGKSAVDLR